MDGAVIDRSDGPHGTATATFDATRSYRFHLDRTWDATGPTVAFVMLNPSTADAEVLDPTVRRCVGFARTWGFGSLRVVNLFAYRATDPADLVVADEPVGVGNDEAILGAAAAADRVVAAWGTRAPIATGPRQSSTCWSGTRSCCPPSGLPGTGTPAIPCTYRRTRAWNGGRPRRRAADQGTSRPVPAPRRGRGTAVPVNTCRHSQL